MNQHPDVPPTWSSCNVLIELTNLFGCSTRETWLLLKRLANGENQFAPQMTSLTDTMRFGGIHKTVLRNGRR